MPELPEVEAVCVLMRKALKNRKIVRASVAPDDIVLGKVAPEQFESALVGQKVLEVGRKGKYWWLELDSGPWLYGHLGMSGWIRQIGGPEFRLHSHGDAPLDDPAGEPRFLKLSLEVEDGGRIVFTDGRRLGRLWLHEGDIATSPVQKLGPDAYRQLEGHDEMVARLAARKTSIKAVLLDQSTYAGIGNWIADEVLYFAKIDPRRLASSLTAEEVFALRSAIVEVIGLAVRVGADYTKFPPDWLFHQRWGGNKGSDFVAGEPIVRETVAGRTTAWVPSIQK